MHFYDQCPPSSWRVGLSWRILAPAPQVQASSALLAGTSRWTETSPPKEPLPKETRSQMRTSTERPHTWGPTSKKRTSSVRCPGSQISSPPAFGRPNRAEPSRGASSGDARGRPRLGRAGLVHLRRPSGRHGLPLHRMAPWSRSKERIYIVATIYGIGNDLDGLVF